jgi:hypothetical protein
MFHVRPHIDISNQKQLAKHGNQNISPSIMVFLPAVAKFGTAGLLALSPFNSSNMAWCLALPAILPPSLLVFLSRFLCLGARMALSSLTVDSSALNDRYFGSMFPLPLGLGLPKNCLSGEVGSGELISLFGTGWRSGLRYWKGLCGAELVAAATPGLVLCLRRLGFIMGRGGEEPSLESNVAEPEVGLESCSGNPTSGTEEVLDRKVGSEIMFLVTDFFLLPIPGVVRPVEVGVVRPVEGRW